MDLNKMIRERRLKRHKKRRKNKKWSEDFPEVVGAKRVIKQMDKAIKILTGRLQQAKKIKKENELLIKSRS